VPFPHAADNHQAANAAFFAEQGGAVVVDQPHLGDLEAAVRDLIRNDDRLALFRAGLARLDRVAALDLILDDLLELAGRGRDASRPAAAGATAA